MNNTEIFIIALMTLLEAEDGLELKTFADKNGFTLEECIDFLEALSKTPFYYDSQIDFKFLHNGMVIDILENTELGKLTNIDDTLENRDLSKLAKEDGEFKEEITEITFSDLKSNVEQYKEMILKIDVDRKKLKSLMKVFLKLDAIEELELYSIVNNREVEDIEAASIIKSILESSYKNKFDILKDREVIKIPNINIKKNMDKLICLYDWISEDKIVNIKNNKTNSVTTSVKLTRVYYDLDAHTWKLEFLTKGNRQTIRLDYLSDDIDESIEISDTINISKERNKTLYNKVKFRVFNEENAKEKALRYAVKYNMELPNVNDVYTDIIINVQDDEKFLRWVRTMTPSVVVLEPERLRQKMINEIKEWDKVYS